MRIMGRPNSSRVFGFPPASSIARRTGADECTALAIAKELLRLPCLEFGSAPSESKVLIASTDSGRCHDCMTSKLSSVAPSLAGACKSGTPFAAARIASGSFFTIPWATANRAGCLPKSHLPESCSACSWRAVLLAFFQGNKTNDKKRNHSANTDKNYNSEHADRPFEYSSSFHSFATAEHTSNRVDKPLTQ